MEHKENGSQPQDNKQTMPQADGTSAHTNAFERGRQALLGLSQAFGFNGGLAALNEQKHALQAAPSQDNSPDTAQVDTSFNIYSLYRGFNAAANFIDALKLYHAGVLDRTQKAELDPANNLMPCAAERLLARWLEEAGLLKELPSHIHESDEKPHWPQMRLIMLHHTGMVYLRIEEFPVPYAIKLRIIRIEAALNRMLMATTKADTQLTAMTEQELYTYTQAITDAICQQHDVCNYADKPNEAHSNPNLPHEWQVREAVSTGFETWLLPYRFIGLMRSNVARGAVALEVELTPPAAMPQSYWSDDVHNVLPTSQYMRNTAASTYALRLGILAASTAFDANEAVRQVYVAGVINTSTARSCRYSVCFTRNTFTSVATGSLAQLQESYHAFGAALTLEDGWLAPCKQDFFLEDELFCPPERYASIELSTRVLDEKSAELLGTHHVSEFGINEHAHIEQVAEQLGMHLGTTVTEHVQALMNLTPSTSSFTDSSAMTSATTSPSNDGAAHSSSTAVADAITRTASKLIEGTLDAEDYQAILEEFAYGDELSRVREEAFTLFTQGKNEETCRLIASVLEPLETAHAYDPTSQIPWRHFETYTERALYNRTRMTDDALSTPRLVPAAYYSCLLMYASASVRLGQLEQGIRSARKCLALNPYDIRARLLLAGALEQGGDQPGAFTELLSLLRYAYSGDSMGIGLYRLGSYMWKRNQPRVADACYSKALQFASTAHDMAAAELKALMEEHKDSYEPVQIDEIDAVLQDNNIPRDVDEGIRKSLHVIAHTAVDEQLFELASDVMSNLTNLESDEILFDIDRSLEHAPDA